MQDGEHAGLLYEAGKPCRKATKQVWRQAWLQVECCTVSHNLHRPPPRKVLQQVSESMNDKKKHKPNIGRGQGFHAGFAGFGPFEQVFQAGSKKSKKKSARVSQG